MIDQQSKEVPYVATRADLGMKDYSGMQDHLPPSQRTSKPATYIGDELIINSAFPARAGPGPSLLEQEWFNNRAYLMNLMGEAGERSSGFDINPERGQVYYKNLDPDETLGLGKDGIIGNEYERVVDKTLQSRPNINDELIYGNWSAPAGFDDFTDDGSVAREDALASFIQRVLNSKD